MTTPSDQYRQAQGIHMAARGYSPERIRDTLGINIMEARRLVALYGKARKDEQK